MGTKYLLGNGTIHLAERNSNGTPKNIVSLGNCPEFIMNFATERLSHFESESGQNVQDLDIITQKTGELNIRLEEIFAENIAFLTNGKVNTIAAVTNQSDVYTLTVAVGQKFKLTKGSGMGITNLAVTSTPSATWTAGTHYSLDAANGIVTILALPSGGPFTTITFGGYSAAAKTSVSFFTDTSKEYFLYFAGINKAMQGKKVFVELYRCSFNPAQDISLIGTEVASFTLSGRMLSDAARELDSTLGPFGRMIYTEDL